MFWGELEPVCRQDSPVVLGSGLEKVGCCLKLPHEALSLCDYTSTSNKSVGLVSVHPTAGTVLSSVHLFTHVIFAA